MGKVLVIAEKPSVGRDIAKVLQCNKKGDGCLIGESYIVSWAIGHLISLCDAEEYDSKYKKWKMDTLPIIPEKIKLKPIKQTVSQYKILKNLMNSKDIDSLICATDSGREGELIFRYIYDYAKCKKPFQRLWISSMTDEAIKDGFANLKDGKDYDNLYASAKCRSEADWIVGINASRAYTLQYNTLLSIGRVQTPTLAIMVQRQKEIDAFVSKPYWEVEAVFEDYSGIWIDLEKNETKIDTEEKAKEISQKVLKREGYVRSVENEEKKQLPPLLYDLTELQRDCNKKFGFSAQKTLSIAQDLYEKRKMITYPRTDSRYLSEDMRSKVKATLKKINIEPYKQYLDYVLSLEELPFNKRIIDNGKVTDHHAIIPTEVYPKLNSLSADEYKVYDLVVRRFIAVFYPPYIYLAIKVITEVEKENFISKGNTVTQLGWMELYKIDEEQRKKNKKEKEEQKLPPLKQGDKKNVNNTKVNAKKTQPPKPYTEAALLSAMENAGRLIEDEALKEQMKDSGLGTPATRAAIIERLLKVGYIERKNKALIPSEKGMKLVEIVPEEMKSAETTGKWEKGLSSIAKGKMQPERFMGSIGRYVNFLVEDAQKVKSEINFPKEERKLSTKGYIAICPLCKKGHIMEHSKGFFCTAWKEGCKFTIWKSQFEPYNIKVDKKMIKTLLTEKKVENVKLYMPDTKEEAIGEILLKEDMSGKVELKNIMRIEEKSK